MLLQHLVEFSDKWIDLDRRPSNLGLGPFTHPRIAIVFSSRNKLSTRKRGCYGLGLARLGVPMFHFETYTSRLYDCLPIEERIGSVLGTLHKSPKGRRSV